MPDGSNLVLDWKQPDYTAVFAERMERLRRIRQGQVNLSTLKVYYKDHIDDFINDWGVTIDPRNIEIGVPAEVPFILFPKQREWIHWLLERWKAREPGITEKSRDMGLSWLMVGTACSLCLFYPGMAVGFGSRKQEYVDRLGDPKSLFYKARKFIENLPKEFRPGWRASLHAPHMRIMFPATSATITGEAGDNIGRGDRTALYFTDEDAYIEHPELVDAALSNTTNCRQRVSSVNGMANTFAIKRHEGKVKVFTFHWRDDPRKDEKWYKKKQEEEDPLIVAQEIDIDYAASVAGSLIPSAWVQAAVDAHIKLKWPVQTGRRITTFDVADEGKDLCAVISGIGSVIDYIGEWSGVGLDIYSSTVKAFDGCDEIGSTILRYDADGLGSGVKGDADRINQVRREDRRKQITVDAFKGSMGVQHPEREDVKGRKNIDFFANYKAQCWWRLRHRFYCTWQAVTQGKTRRPEECISIASEPRVMTAAQTSLSGGALRNKLVMEIPQPQFDYGAHGKIIIEKTPDGARSPNLADACMMWGGASSTVGLVISDDVLRTTAMVPRGVQTTQSIAQNIHRGGMAAAMAKYRGTR